MTMPSYPILVDDKINFNYYKDIFKYLYIKNNNIKKIYLDNNNRYKEIKIDNIIYNMFKIPEILYIIEYINKLHILNNHRSFSYLRNFIKNRKYL